MRAPKWVLALTMVTTLCSFGALLAAENAPAGDVIKDRVANFRKIGKAFKHIRDELKGQNPSLATIQESATQIESLGSQIVTWFPPGTDQGGKTRAKPEVWTDRDRFEQAQKKMAGEAQKMNQLARAGSKDAIAAQYRVLGETCKNCHDTFRGKGEDNN
jgi:cytochrome c556